MFKKDPILKGWDMQLNRESQNYKEVKALLQEFEKKYIRQKKQTRLFSFPFIQYDFHPGPSVPLLDYRC